MRTSLITYDEMKAALERAVAERGEGYVYPAEWRDAEGLCKYTNEDGSPSCIVGLAMSYLRPDITPKEYTDAKQVLEGIATKRAARLAQNVQSRQDDGFSWGGALQTGLKMETTP